MIKKRTSPARAATGANSTAPVAKPTTAVRLQDRVIDTQPPLITIRGSVSSADTEAVLLRIPRHLLESIEGRIAGSRTQAIIYLIERAWDDITASGKPVTIDMGPRKKT